MNCDELLQQTAQLKEENRRLGADRDRTERVNRALGQAAGERASDATKVWRNLVGVAESDAMRAQIRRSLLARETPVGADGRFQNFAQLADLMDQAQAEQMGAMTEALLGNWEKGDLLDHAWVTSTTSPEEFAGWIAKGYSDFGLNYDAMLQAATANLSPFMRLVENGTRLRVMADIAKHNLIEDVAAIRGFMEEAGAPPPAELGRKFVQSYSKALVLERHFALSRRRGGQYLQSLQRSITDGVDTPPLAPDIWAPPEATAEAPGIGITAADITDSTLLGKVLQAADNGPDGVEALKQLELDIRVDSIDPQATLDDLWRSPAARRDLGYFKDAQLYNPETQLLKNFASNRLLEKYGLIRTAIENGPKMAPFGTRLLRTSWKDRIEGIQVAWEANRAMQESMRLGFRELYWERFLDGNTPFANDISMHGKPMLPEEALTAARGVLWKPLDFRKNPLGDEGVIRDVRDKVHVATKLTIRAMLKKATGVDFPVTQAFAGLAAVDNVAGMRMYRFKLRNDLMMQARRDGVQLGLMDEATGLVDTDRMHQWVEEKMQEAVYQQIPTERNLLDFRKQHGITPEIADDETLRAYIMQSGVAGHPVLNDPLRTGAWDYAQRLRMQNDPQGVMGKADDFIKAIQQSSWIGDALLPYRKIPLNALLFDLTTAAGPVPSTLKLLSERLHGRTPTAAQIAEVEASWVTSAFLAASFFALDNGIGKLTGNGPVDPKARQEWDIRMRAEGRVPNSVFGIPLPLGGVPLLNTLFLWKDVRDAMEAAGASDMDTRTVAMGFMQVLAGVIVRQTPLATFQRLIEVTTRGDEQAWGKFAGWLASGQFNPVSGPTRAAERYTGNTKRDFYDYPRISAADQQLMNELPQELRHTADGLRNLLVTLQPMAGRIAGVAHREKDWLGRDIHLPEGLNQEDFPSGFPGFYTSPVHRELEKQQLLDPPASLLSAHLQGVPLSPDAQKEFNGYLGATKGEDDFAAQRILHGKGFTYSITGTKETIIPLPNGERIRFGASMQIPTALTNVVQRSIRGNTVYQAMNALFKSPEYRALQANPITSSNPEVRDLPPAARLQQPGPWMIQAIKSYYELRALGQLEASDTPWAKEWQALRNQKTLRSLEQALQKASAVNGAVSPAR